MKPTPVMAALAFLVLISCMTIPDSGITTGPDEYSLEEFFEVYGLNQRLDNIHVILSSDQADPEEFTVHYKYDELGRLTEMEYEESEVYARRLFVYGNASLGEIRLQQNLQLDEKFRADYTYT